MDNEKKPCCCCGTPAQPEAAVKRLAAFGEKMKWETVGTPVEQKQGLSATKYEECLALGKEMAGKLKMEN